MSVLAAFQDVHVMIFIGFGFLMTFLCRYGYSAVGLNFFMASLIVQWAMIVRGFVYQGTFTGKKYKIVVDEMVTADFASATVLISFGAVLGKTTPLQLLIMGLIEVILAQINGMVCHDKLHAVDVGESMYIHAFGAYFGLAVSRMLYSEKAQKSQKSESVYHSDLFSMIGTVFLWMYWPSFNGGGAEGDEQHRAYINTYLSLAACTVVTFAMSAIYDKKGKFTMEFVQNATLAGGVAVGTTANMPLQPYGALIMGSVAGLISVTGYKYISGFLTDKLRIQDTCGVNNLHGMPAILAAIAGAVMAAMSSEDKWGRSMYEIFPYTVPATGADFDALVQRYPDLEPGKGWSSGKQGGYQMLALVITLGIAIVGGILTVECKLNALFLTPKSGSRVYWSQVPEIHSKMVTTEQLGEIVRHYKDGGVCAPCLFSEMAIYNCKTRLENMPMSVTRHQAEKGHQTAMTLSENCIDVRRNKVPLIMCSISSAHQAGELQNIAIRRHTAERRNFIAMLQNPNPSVMLC
ncbi:RHBG-like protein [Mya arenaria]|uniref:RHBG-like protein n=1 Tax=Mya arenaria TaxID=6604 RepID=A0ABY7E5K6_MYAAR|nr:RHBG-like protein [Mya arenaria]